MSVGNKTPVVRCFVHLQELLYVAYFKMVHNAECKKDSSHYQLNNRNDFQFLSS